jgi:hypothetical protein
VRSTVLVSDFLITLKVWNLGKRCGEHSKFSVMICRNVWYAEQLRVVVQVVELPELNGYIDVDTT